jgi:pyruvate dehydrogenase E2 component (dihydrolipoamide acetyltransferase)
MIEFKMPSLGADMEDGILREWKVKPGDTIKRGDIIAEVEVQKGNIDIECFDEGTIMELLVKENEKVPVGMVMAKIKPLNETSTVAEDKKVDIKEIVKEEIKPLTEENKQTEIPVIIHSEIKASPLAKRLASEKNIDLTTIKGTGEDGVITKEDVENAVSNPKIIDAKKNTTPAENIRMAVAAAMSKSNREIPHYYLEKKIDVTNAIKWLTENNAEKPIQKRLLSGVLFLKATAMALTEVPELNAVWENGLIKKEGIHIGMVVSLRGGGIIVPAIHDVSKKNLEEIMDALNDIIPRARAMKLRSSELSDSTITITNLGEGGADKVFGIIYPPQVAIIGIGDIIKETIFINGTHEEHSFVYVTLAGDHRATDGLTGSKFLNVFYKLLQKPETL